MIGFVRKGEIKGHTQISEIILFLWIFLLLPTPFDTLNLIHFFPEEQSKGRYAIHTLWPPVLLIALFIKHTWCAWHD